MKKNLLFILCYLGGMSYSVAQYCMLPGRTPYSTLQPGITNFQLNTINRTSGNSESNSSVVVTTGLSTTLTAGQTYTISISHSEDTQFFIGDRNNIRVWIDYNKNSLYTNPGETVVLQDMELPGTTFTTTITIPLSTPPGTLALRATAKMSSDAGHTFPTPCDSPADPLGYHGEMEDYTLFIENPGFPASSFVMSSSVCIVSSATVSNNSAGTPAPTYSWTSNPSTGVSFSPNNSAANPQISFSGAGIYTVTCIATNSISSNSSSKVINVNDCNFVGISVNNMSERINILPNPSSGHLKVQLPLHLQNAELMVVNSLGQIILKKALIASTVNSIALDLSEFENGIYFLKILSADFNATKQIVLEK